MSKTAEKPLTLEKRTIDQQTAFRRVQYGKEVFNITSIFTGEQGLKEILHNIAVRKIEKLN